MVPIDSHLKILLQTIRNYRLMITIFIVDGGKIDSGSLKIDQISRFSKKKMLVGF